MDCWVVNLDILKNSLSIWNKEPPDVRALVGRLIAEETKQRAGEQLVGTSAWSLDPQSPTLTRLGWSGHVHVLFLGIHKVVKSQSDLIGFTRSIKCQSFFVQASDRVTTLHIRHDERDSPGSAGRHRPYFGRWSRGNDDCNCIVLLRRQVGRLRTEFYHY